MELQKSMPCLAWNTAKYKGTGLVKVCGITFPHCYQKNLGLFL